MSVKNKKVITKPSTSKSQAQRFIRLNLDQALEQMLQEYEAEYRLLSRADIIRMLLSKVYNDRKQKARQKMLALLDSLPKPEVELSEDQMFQILEENDLM
jgi:hypothetical protein